MERPWRIHASLGGKGLSSSPRCHSYLPSGPLLSTWLAHWHPASIEPWRVYSCSCSSSSSCCFYWFSSSSSKLLWMTVLVSVPTRPFTSSSLPLDHTSSTPEPLMCPCDHGSVLYHLPELMSPPSTVVPDSFTASTLYFVCFLKYLCVLVLIGVINIICLFRYWLAWGH